MSRDQVPAIHAPAALLVDAGNTRLKWALWDKGQYGEQKAHAYSPEASSPDEALSFLTVLLKKFSPKKIVLVHVLGSVFSDAVKTLSEKYNCILFSVNTTSDTYGISIAYENPAHFGADRLIALLAAQSLSGTQSAIIIDCGTAVTVDALDYGNQHLGGLILPGLNLLSDSLIRRTQAKHMAAFDFNAPNIFADNTKQAIGSGCLFSLVGAIEGICLRMQNEMSAKPLKIICGGDAALVHAHLAGDYQLEPSALIRGLSVIAESS